MMCVHGRRKLVHLFSRNSSFALRFKSHVLFTVSLHFFSTSGEIEKQPIISRTVSDFLLKKHHFSPQAASQIASVLTCLKNPEKSDSILLFLKNSGFSNTQLEKLVKYKPGLLSASLENIIKPKIKIFQDLGFSADDIATIFTTYPSIMFRSANNSLMPSLTLLSGLLGSTAEVAKLLRICGWFLTKNLEKDMVPNMDFLKSCGVERDHVISFIFQYPRCILLKPEILRKCVEKTNGMGANQSDKMYIHALGVLCSLSENIWELKLEALRNLGFSESDILMTFRKAPQVFAISVEKIKGVNEVLLGTGKYDISCIIANPKSLMASVEARYQPRLHVLHILEKRKLIIGWPRLGMVSGLTDEEFFEKFVVPYSNEIGDVCIGKFGVSCRRGMKT